MADFFDKEDKSRKKQIDDQVEAEQELIDEPQKNNLKSEDIAVDNKKYMQNLNNFIMSKFQEKKQEGEIEKH